jgi:hypothetical protein
MVDLNITSSCWWRTCVSKTHKILNQGEHSSPEQGTCCWSAAHPPQCKTFKKSGLDTFGADIPLL